ncbi:hypothetical protein [Rubripirellula amarantea]|nr:hypothetical protein [Rubripirellula amarantea]
MMFRIWLSLGLLIVCVGQCHAQITASQVSSGTGSRSATLEEQLVNRLRASAEDQRNYLKYVVKQVELGKIDVKLVVGIERYALRRNPSLPFPFFERAFRYEASRRGLTVPPVRQFATAGASGGIRR